MGTNLDEFIEYISGKPSVIYFHNLAFDGSFILDWLFRHDYSHTVERVIRPGQFCTLISNMGKFYSITVCWWNGVRTEFRDSLKKLPMS
jgi:hypothetical protein